MNDKSIDYVDFYDDLDFYLNEYVSGDPEGIDYTWNDLHSVWVYLYKQDPGLIPCYQEVDISATILFKKFKEFLEKQHYDNYVDALCLMVVFEQKVNKLLQEYYDGEND